MEKEILVSAEKIPVFDETDVLVVGGGAAGTSAAVAAARLGARVILLERYGYLGGLVTGGQVIIIPNMDNGTDAKVMGIQREWMNRLGCYTDGVCGPAPGEAGSRNEALIKKWAGYYGVVWNGQICYTTFVDPEMLKVVLNQMVREAGVTTYFHCLGTRAYVDGGKVKGVIFESKEGRKAILAKVVIDASGEGDIFASAGAEYEDDADPTLRNSNISQCYRLAGVDFEVFAAWKVENPQLFMNMIKELQALTGYLSMPIPSSRKENAVINNWLTDLSTMSVRDLSATELKVTCDIPVIINYLQKSVPGFAECYLMDIGASIGARHSRRVKGVHKITLEELRSATRSDSDIAVTPCMHAFDMKAPDVNMYIPYWALVPEKLNGLLVAGRCLSADVRAHNCLNLIPHSVCTGEAAGTAAYLAASAGIEPRAVDVAVLRKTLIKQGAYLEEKNN